MTDALRSSTSRPSTSGSSPSAGSRPRRARSARSTSSTPSRCGRSRRSCVLCLVEARFPSGTHETYQVPLGLRPVAEGWDRARDPRDRRVDGLRRARGPRGGPRAAAPHALELRVPGRPGRVHLPLGARSRRRPRRDGRRAAGRRRAVQLLDRLRRRADHEGVPQDRAGREPGARAAALPDRPRLPAHRLAGGLVRGRRAPDRRHAGDPAGVPARLPRRLGARAGRAGVRPDGAAGQAGGARHA